MASLNVLVLAGRSRPGGGGEIAARAELPAEGARAERPRGEAVIFRPRGERPARAPATAREPPPSAATPAGAPIDDGSFAYLGTMTAPDGASSYFFKDRATDRVYSAGAGNGELAVIEASEKEFLIEIHGTKHLVAR